jgi:hypothetical protein
MVQRFAEVYGKIRRIGNDHGRHSDERPAGSVFNTTHWSVVLAAADLTAADAWAALTRLCQTYWYPLYRCVRRHGYSPEDAQDLTQAFFAKLLSKNQVPWYRIKPFRL